MLKHDQGAQHSQDHSMSYHKHSYDLDPLVWPAYAYFIIWVHFQERKSKNRLIFVVFQTADFWYPLCLLSVYHYYRLSSSVSHLQTAPPFSVLHVCMVSRKLSGVFFYCFSFKTHVTKKNLHDIFFLPSCYWEYIYNGNPQYCNSKKTNASIWCCACGWEQQKSTLQFTIGFL